MKNIVRMLIFSAFLMGLMGTLVWADPVEVSTTVETITGPRMRFDSAVLAEQSYILINVSVVDINNDSVKDIDPIAVLLLFPGGGGKLKIANSQLGIRSTNFLVRTRNHFAAKGLIVAVMDAASDFLDLAEGLKGHRVPGKLHSAEHLQDIEAVMGDLRGKFPLLPLWAVGTSRGTISAARAAAEATNPADGLVLTASLTGPSGNGDLSGVHLESVEVPTLIVTNKDDECSVTQPKDSKNLKTRLVAAPKVKVRIFKGGSTPLTDACSSLSAHGFFGIEQKVVNAVTRWIKRAVH